MTGGTGIQPEILRFRRQVDDALELLAFAVSEGRAVADAVVAGIRRAQDLMASTFLPSVEERIAFDQAYRDLAVALAPVTVETLHATSDEFARRESALLAAAGHTRRSVFAPWGPVSEAKIWSRKLWLATIAVIALVLIVEGVNPASAWSQLCGRLCPFLYGSLGALVYLLRSCHEHIHRREFDRHRVPEYYNRVLLGAVSGGAILLYTGGVRELTVSNSAVAFLAGYNTDFFFSALERVAAALLPKIAAHAASTPATAVVARAETTTIRATAATRAADERVTRVQSFLAETGVPEYAPGATDGIWDERTRLAAIAFLQANYRSLPVYAALEAAPDFASFDSEMILAEMSPFVLPEMPKAA